jgi:hypothetical protein
MTAILKRDSSIRGDLKAVNKRSELMGLSNLEIGKKEKKAKFLLRTR